VESRLTDEQILEKAPEAKGRNLNGEKFKRLWAGEYVSGDDSADDMALANILAFWCGRDAGQMERLLHQSGRWREKWDEAHYADGETYLDHLIRKAIQDCSTAYRDGQNRDGQSSKFFNADGKFLHNVMGDHIIETLDACKINGAVHIYDTGVYKPGVDLIHGHMIRLLPGIKNIQRREVYQYIKASLNTPVKSLSSPYLIPFASKIYDLNTGNFLDYGPQHVFLNRFPYDYKPGAPRQPRIENVLWEIADMASDILSLLFEILGNGFFLQNSYRGMVALYGAQGNNGKSTLLNMIRQLYGESNCSFLSLQDMGERFRLCELYGKAANIGDDIPDSYIPDTSNAKKAVTGEMLTVEKKGQDAFAFRPYAKLFFAMNNPPAVKDKSKAFFGRMIIIPLNRNFKSSPSFNPAFKDIVWTPEEMEWLTARAVEGLCRLMQQRDFTRPAAVQNALDEYERENNPVIEFLETYGDVTGKRTREVYDAYRMWSLNQGIRNLLKHSTFSREVLRLQPQLISSHAWETGKTVRIFSSKRYSGLRIVTDKPPHV
jgi:putative DNA primase/helicase